MARCRARRRCRPRRGRRAAASARSPGPSPRPPPRSRAASSTWRWRSTTRAIAQFPALLVAWIIQLRRAAPLALTAAVRRPPTPLPSTQVGRSSRLPLLRSAPPHRRRCGASCSCARACWPRSAAGVSGTVAFEAVEPALRPGRAGAGLPGAALARPRRGAAPPAGQAHAAAGGRCSAVHRAGAGLAARAGRPTSPSRWSTRRSRPPSATRHPRPGQLHQRLPAPLPARARRAGCGHRARAGGAVEPSALVDRAPQARPSARLAARARRPTTRRRR